MNGGLRVHGESRGLQGRRGLRGISDAPAPGVKEESRDPRGRREFRARLAQEGPEEIPGRWGLPGTPDREVMRGREFMQVPRGSRESRGFAVTLGRRVIRDVKARRGFRV